MVLSPSYLICKKAKLGQSMYIIMCKRPAFQSEAHDLQVHAAWLDPSIAIACLHCLAPLTISSFVWHAY